MDKNQTTTSESKPKSGFFSKPWVRSVGGAVVIILALVGILVWKDLSARVAIDDSLVSAPVIAIGPQNPGILDEVYVQPGDTVTADEPVARVGSEILSTQIAGVVVDVQNTPGQVFSPGTAVVSMIDPRQLRIVGTIDEDKGLSSIQVGDPATFTVDAFGSQQFTGVVDEISPTAVDTGVLFDISDKRPTNQFLVKVRYDITAYPQFKNGMSAKLKVYIK